MIGSPPVARDAIDASNVPRTPEQVVGETKVVAQTSQLLVITVTDTEPAVAQKLADGMADAFVAKVQQLEPGSTEGALPTLPAYKFESASLPVVPLPSDLSKNLVLAALFGLLVSCAVAFVLEYLDLTVRTVEDAERRFGLPVLGVIPELGKGLAPATQRLQPVDEIGTARGA
jgi:capsular polysaccharide biosynthesis protein